MKFQQHLKANCTPEWRTQYINYEQMKKMLSRVKTEAEISERPINSMKTVFDEEFIPFCEKELKKVTSFFKEKLAEAIRKQNSLLTDLEIAKDAVSGRIGRFGSLKRPKRKTKDLKLAYSEFYLSLILLKNYQALNFTGFRKILKKHDKILQTDNGNKWQIENVVKAHFHTDKKVDLIIKEIEELYTREFENGDRHRAMKRLRVPPLGVQKTQWSIFTVGFFLGIFILLFLEICLFPLINFQTPNPINQEGCNSSSNSSHYFGQRKFNDEKSSFSNEYNWNIFLRLYRGPFWITLSLCLIGVNLAAWRKNGINHVLIFELDPRSNFLAKHLYILSTVLGICWCLSILGFFYGTAIGIPPFIFPLMLVIIKLLVLVVPVPMLRNPQKWLWTVLGRIVMAPFCQVKFADFWLADQLMSLNRVFADTDDFITIYVSNKWYTSGGFCDIVVNTVWWINLILLCLPPWFRFAQCIRRYWDSHEKFPHLANAAKYATTFPTVIFSSLLGAFPYHPQSQVFNALWIVFLCLSSIYGLIWDLKMDWGLLNLKAENIFLREDLLYSSPWYYYGAIISDILLRFNWAFSISFSETGLLSTELATTIFGTFEILRRFIWNFFRLENEHLNNCGKFRAVRDISVKPLVINKAGDIVEMVNFEFKDTDKIA
ncbi:solute carrier family 53 member 1-like [Artemia franciscana]|uniref:solute carrier family 53 member 1-like n=1 Tax=Artemia franciscana TaxID=6661 RepID=UPI0032DA3B0D